MSPRPERSAKSSAWQEFREFCTYLYNPTTHRVMNRTGMSWLKIGSFYLVFFSFLACFFGGNLWIAVNLIEDRFPKYQLEASIIGTNPGLGFRPMPNLTSSGGMLIDIRTEGSKSNWDWWDAQLNKFLKEYRTRNSKAQYVRCNPKRRPSYDEVCEFSADVITKSGCGVDGDFGYRSGTPCVVLKLNKIFNWEPVTYDATNLPEDVPLPVASFIKANQTDQNQVWISCEGANPADKENIGHISYHPQPGFPAYFYPYTNAPGYVSPLVGIKFHSPKRKRIVHVECKAWAKNIEQNTANRRGIARFELLIE